jgi:hypothetical protein
MVGWKPFFFSLDSEPAGGYMLRICFNRTGVFNMNWEGQYHAFQRFARSKLILLTVCQKWVNRYFENSAVGNGYKWGNSFVSFWEVILLDVKPIYPLNHAAETQSALFDTWTITLGTGNEVLIINWYICSFFHKSQDRPLSHHWI